jgi:Zn-dependent M28 family amino/carboxypeptidase
VVVFGAHYDSLNLRDRSPDVVAPGANDNATGTAGVLEAARLLSRSDHDRTIVFACFTAEEQGLIGAWHFAKFLKDSDLTVVAMLNNDIIGGAKDDNGKPLNEKDVRCFSDGPQESDSRRLARLAKLVVERRIKDFGVLLQDRKDRPGRGGDHQSFNAHGMAAIRFIETNETDKLHHTADDVIDRIHFPYHVRVVRADVALLANLASALPAPSAVELKDKVTWKPVEGAKRYLVGVRRGELEFGRMVESEAAEAKIEFGVEGTYSVCVAAVDARGNVSLFSPEATIGIKK